ncbi:MAG: hypothetical protein HY073_02180 [Deltaproteobacteria bacterium]|nr:hypothetical protein [Deltaproteobacteria bacterium]
MDECHEAGTCEAATGLCSNPNKVDGTACTGHNICSTYTCSAGTCSENAKAGCCQSDADCDDHDQCNGQEICKNNQCQAGFPLAVPLSTTPCVTNVCDPKLGIITHLAADGSVCDDNNQCTDGDQCLAGKCAGTPIKVTDNNPCTDDSCDPATGPYFTTKTTALCSDPASCNLDTCTPKDKLTLIGQCTVNCTQPNGAKETSVGLDASCQLTDHPSDFTCSYQKAGADIAIKDGLIPVDTLNSGQEKITATCQAPAGSTDPIVTCSDLIDVKPTCDRIIIGSNGTDITTARVGDSLQFFVQQAGAKQVVFTVNEAKYASVDLMSLPVTYTVTDPNNLLIGATVIGHDNLSAKCESVKVSVSTASCGNGIVEAGEACDDGNNDATDGCVSCQVAQCGDGFVEAGVEECDDGVKNDDFGMSCTSKCKRPVCGDGVIQKALGEQCEPSQKDPTCTDQCIYKPSCTSVKVAPIAATQSGVPVGTKVALAATGQLFDANTYFCLDPLPGAPSGSAILCNRAVSGTNTISAAISSTKTLSGTVNSYVTRSPDNPVEKATCPGVSVSYISNCGNGQLDKGEVCDWNMDDSKGHCNKDCSGYEPSCGDSIRNGAEACDGEDLGEESCLTQGFDGGVLQCHPNCTFDTSQCEKKTPPPPPPPVAVCGNGIVETGEACDSADPKVCDKNCQLVVAVDDTTKTTATPPPPPPPAPVVETPTPPRTVPSILPAGNKMNVALFGCLEGKDMAINLATNEEAPMSEPCKALPNEVIADPKAFSAGLQFNELLSGNTDPKVLNNLGEFILEVINGKPYNIYTALYTPPSKSTASALTAAWLIPPERLTTFSGLLKSGALTLGNGALQVNNTSNTATVLSTLTAPENSQAAATTATGNTQMVLIVPFTQVKAAGGAASCSLIP